MRLIDADAMKKDVKVQTQILKLMFKDDEDGLKLADIMYEGYMAQIDKMPTVELIRCKDCRFSDKYTLDKSDTLWCDLYDDDFRNMDFCSRAERKENGKE